ncbi:MAG: hypothetical protein CMI33_09435 [Opitutales bacterium]|nr:hypothetical protein [Opitutales bacterium]
MGLIIALRGAPEGGKKQLFSAIFARRWSLRSEMVCRSVCAAVARASRLHSIISLSHGGGCFLFLVDGKCSYEPVATRLCFP